MEMMMLSMGEERRLPGMN